MGVDANNDDQLQRIAARSVTPAGDLGRPGPAGERGAPSRGAPRRRRPADVRQRAGHPGRYAIPALVVVLDNGGYGTERPILDGPFNDLQPGAHRELALAMGFCAAERVENEQALWSCLGRWRSEGMAGPRLISVAIPAGAMSALMPPAWPAPAGM